MEDDRIRFEEFLDGKPLEYPLRFIKSGRYMQVDFNEFDLEECNKKLQHAHKQAWLCSKKSLFTQTGSGLN